MRIALYHNLSSGGAKRALYEQIRRLSTKHDIDVYTLSTADHEFSDLRPIVDNYHIIPFNPSPLFKTPFGRLNNVMRVIDLMRLKKIGVRIARLVDRSRYDVAFIHPCRYENSPSILSGLTQTRSVFYCQEPMRILYETYPPRPYYSDQTVRTKFFNRLDPCPAFYRERLKKQDSSNLNKAGTVLVNSENMRDALLSIYSKPARVSYLGVDTSVFRPFQHRRQGILSVGSLTPLKGFDFLIQAVSLIPVSRRPQLRIVSNFENPPERAYIEDLALKMKVEVHLLRNIDEQKLVECYNETIMLVYAPVREPFGLVPLEAMACGTPIVAVREGGVPESVLHEETGLLVSRDPQEFAAAIQRLLDNPDMALTYGRNGRNHVTSNWSWERATDTLEKYLNAANKCDKDTVEIDSVLST